MWKHYYSITSLDEVLSLLAEHAGRARIIAGGTDILIELERGQRPGIDTLIDLSRVVLAENSIRPCCGMKDWGRMPPFPAFATKGLSCGSQRFSLPASLGSART
jgi:hypothetical protein